MITMVRSLNATRRRPRRAEPPLEFRGTTSRLRPRFEWMEDRTLLSGPTDDFPNDLDRAALLALAADGSGSQAGRIETASDVDAFRFVAPVTGQMSIQFVTALGS